jgi:hypothetical protein
VSKQTFVIPPKNYPRPLEVLGEHAAMRASSEVGSELFPKEGSRGSTSSRHCRPSESVPTKTFSKPTAVVAVCAGCVLLMGFVFMQAAATQSQMAR